MTSKGPQAQEFVFEEWLKDTLNFEKVCGKLDQEWQNREELRDEFNKFQQKVKAVQKSQLVATRDFLDGVIDYLDRKESRKA